MPGPASTSPTSRRPTPSPSPRRRRGPWSATPATRWSRTSTVGGGGPSSRRRRCRRTTRSWWPARSWRCAGRSTATTSGSTRARPWRPCCTATPSSCSRSPRRAWRSSGRGSGCPSRNAPTTRCSCPSSAARWRTTNGVTWADDILRRHEPTTSEWQVFTNVLLHEMAHMWFGNIVTMRWWDDLWLNEAFAEFACMWACRASDGVRRHGGQQPRRRQAARLPRRPGPQLAPDPPAGAYRG